ncbi:MBL fold metallo-hydrolase [Chloroflexota bacterium]
MKIKWLGHASFLITTDAGIRIITDPYLPGRGLNYAEINESADIVTTSHDHYDHNNAAVVKGNPEVVKSDTEAKGIKFRGIATYHDNEQGNQRGNNIVICFEIDGIRTCHLGDLGHPLNPEQVSRIGAVDVLLIPVGGHFTIDAKVASQVYDQLKPSVAIPMHFKNERCDFPITGVDDFLQGKGNVNRLDTSETEFTKANLPAKSRIIVLKPAL